VFDPAQTRRELSGARVLDGLDLATRDEVLDRVMDVLANRFSELPLDQLHRVGSRALTWLAWREKRRVHQEQVKLREYATDPTVPAQSDRATEDAEFLQAKEELRQALHEVMANRLSPEERLVITRRIIQRIGAEQVATELGSNVQRVYYLTRRALYVLREELSGFEDLYR
jgi:hypothetical protein